MAQQRGGTPFAHHHDVAERQRDQPVAGEILIIPEHHVEEDREMNGPNQRPLLRGRQLPHHQHDQDRQQKGVDDHREWAFEHEHLDQQKQPAKQIGQQEFRFGEHPIDLADRAAAAHDQEGECEKREIGRGMQLFVEVSSRSQVVNLPVGHNR